MIRTTGSGKTYTMRAIFAAAAAELFTLIDSSAGDVASVAFCELGGSGARDMLNAGASVQMLTDHAGEAQLVPTVEVVAHSPAGSLCPTPPSYPASDLSCS